MTEKTFDEIYSPPYGVELVGPFRGDIYRIIVNGYRVPFLTAYKRGDTDTDWTVVLDERFEYDVNDYELRRFAGLIANAMAIAAGYGCFGENSQPRNLFSNRVIGLTEGDDLFHELEDSK